VSFRQGMGSEPGAPNPEHPAEDSELFTACCMQRVHYSALRRSIEALGTDSKDWPYAAWSDCPAYVGVPSTPATVARLAGPFLRPSRMPMGRDMRTWGPMKRPAGVH